MSSIIDKVDRYADKDIIVRFLVVNLAKFFRRDLDFYLRSTEEQVKMLENGVTYNNDGKIICLTLSEFYEDLFKYFNIESKVVKATRKIVPLYALIVKGTNGYYFVDPLDDLMPSQYGITSKNYGIVPNYTTSIIQDEYPYLKNLTPKYVDHLDLMIKRFSNGIKTDSILDNLRDNITQKKLRRIFGHKVYNIESIDYKLNYISDNCINIGEVHGLIEGHKMYSHLFKSLLENSERGLIEHHIYRDYTDVLQ